MIKRIQYLYLLILLISCALQVQAQIGMPDQVCVGTVKHYWVIGSPGSTYTWRINGVIQSSTADNIDIQWNDLGNFTLDVQEHQLTCDGDVQSGIITVTDQIIPEFTLTNEYCTGSLIAALPTTSANGITGTWAPEINNTQTTIYTFTPNGNQCAVAVDLTITITDGIVPTFTPIAAICSGSTAISLPTVSQNNITGIWSPAFNNTATTAYTFTPDDGQCATTTTLTVAVNDQITPTFAQVGPYCAGFTIPALPTTSSNGITGSWSPAIDNTNTTTYTFTPNAGQCGTTATMTITISDEIIPTFAQVGPFCSGFAIPALPITSTNGITGTWSPAIDNTQTTVYTFTPDANQCGTTTTMTITISDEIIPTFAQVGPFCSGFAIPALPTTSTNGITGTWSPAIDNTQTTVYTFTPDANQCGTTTTMTITISDEIIPTFAQVGPFCSGFAIPALPTTSTNGITGTWSPAIDNTQTTVYTFTPDANQCGTTATMTITISDEIIPTFAQVGPFCSGFAIPALPTTSTNGITGSWSPAIDNTQTTVYTFTPDANQCGTTATMTITISDEITPTFAQVGPYCAGFAIPALPTTSSNGITGTWSPAIDNTQTTEYTFTPNEGQCGTTTLLTITVEESITPTFDPVGPYQAGSAIASLPTVSNNGIQGTWSPAINNNQTTTYTFTPDANQCAGIATLTIVINQEDLIPTFDPIGPLCRGAEITLPTASTNGITGSWSPVVNNTQTTTYTFTPDAGQGAGIAQITIEITDPTIPLFAQVGPYCSGTAIDELPATSTNGITGTWSPVIDNTQTTTYTFTPDEGQCATSTTFTITIADGIAPIFAQVGPFCPGETIADLPFTSTNGITGSWSPAIDNTQTTEYTFTPDAGQCAIPTTMTITITDQIIPTFDPIAPICIGGAITLPGISREGIQGTWSPAIDNTQTTIYTFTPIGVNCAVPGSLTVEVSESIIPTFDPVGPYCLGSDIPALPTTSTNNITGTWSPAIDNTQTTIYTFTPDAGNCGAITQLTIAVEESITPTFAAVGTYCSGSNIPELPTRSTNNITGSWSPAIDNTHTTTYTFTPDAGQCGESTTLTIEINPLVIPSFDGVGAFCQGADIDALPTVSTNGISGSWSPAFNNQQTTTYTFTPDGGQCASTASMSIVINRSVIPTFDPVNAYCPGSDIPALPTVSTNGISGSWSPEINNQQTTTYTFTPDGNTCASTASMTIVIDQNITPTFDPMGPFCPGYAIAALPGISREGIVGTWSPEIDNTQTTTYTFTPNEGQCGSTATLTIAIEENIQPTFDAMGPFCLGFHFSLPSVSREGIAGTWSPEVDNTQTTTYTFTPQGGDCSIAASLTIEIENSITPEFNVVSTYCAGDNIPELPTVSTNGISGSWSPSINNTSTTTYVFTPDNECASTASLTININRNILPTFDINTQYCQGETISALPGISNNGITGSWSPAIDNSRTTTYLFTSDPGQCATSTSMTISIEQGVLPLFSPMGSYCSGQAIAALPTTSNNGITGTWSPEINNTQTTTYTFTPNSGQCASPVTTTIRISDLITPTFNPVAPVCSGASITLPAISTNGIRGSWSPAIDNTRTTTYTFTPNDGQCATIATMTITVYPIMQPIFDPVGPYCSGDIIGNLPPISTNGILGTWRPAINNTRTTIYTFTPDADQCAIITTMTITIDQRITPTFDPVGPYCLGQSIEALPTTSTNGITGTWSPEINNSRTTIYTFTPDEGQCALPTTLTINIGNELTPTFTQVGPYCADIEIPALPTTSNNGIHGSWSPEIDPTQTTTYTFTPDPGGCATTASMTIAVSDQVTPIFVQVGPYCAGAAIAALPTISNNGIRGTWSPAINNTQTTTYTFTPNAGQCGIPVTMTIEISDEITPAFDPIGPYCRGANFTLPAVSTNGIRGSWRPAINNTQTTNYTFTPDAGQCGSAVTLTVAISDEIVPTFTAVGSYCAGAGIEALPTVSNNGITGSWSPGINNQQTTTYTFMPDAGQCGTTASMTITISNEVIPTFSQVGSYCAGAVIAALPATSSNGIHGSWSPEIDNTQTTTYTFTPDPGGCATTASMTIIVSDEVTPIFSQPAAYCVGAVIPALPTISNNGIRGSWSPAINNLQTTTYTFTPNTGQCGTTASLTIEISDEIIPTFDPVGPYMLGSVIPALPVVSNNGIRGTWSPAINNQLTTTYTFTPNAGQCAVTTTLTIDISDRVIPTFDPVGPYCSGSAIAALPGISTNGIRGTWSPAINNTQTTTYTFTPDEGQSADIARLTITINDEVRPTFTTVGPYCAGSTIDALPLMSINGITGTWSPAIDNTQTTTYNFTPDEGQCATNVTLTIVISDEIIPTFTQAGPYCSGSVIAALPTTSSNGINGTWSPAINNTRTTTYTFTPDAGQCASSTTMIITINPTVTPAFDPAGPFCPGAVIADLPTISNNGIQGTWSPAINNNRTTTYTFTPTAGQCAEPVTLTIEVSDEILPTFNPVGPFCPGAVIADLPTTSTNGIRGRWRPAINNRQTTTYTFTPEAGECGTSTTMTIAIQENATPTFDPVGPYCAGSIIAALPTVSNNGIHGSWSPAINNNRTTTYTFTPNQGECGTSTTLTIVITDPIVPTFDPIGPYCVGSVIAALPTVSNNGISGSWSPAINNQQTTTYTFTPDAGQCTATTTLRIVINQRNVPTFEQVATYCQGSAIAALHTVSNNGIRGSWRPAINNTRTTTYTFTPDAGQCSEPTSMTIEITDEIDPIFDPVGPYHRGEAIAALNTVSNNGIHGTWRPAINNTQTTTYTFIPDAGQCSRPFRMTITITDDIIPVFNPVGAYCPGSAIAALPTVSNNGILGSWSPAINNQQTTTYTFTPDAGQGATSVTMTITISDAIVPTFDPVGPYCQGSIIAALPVVSNNNIRGTWSPAINNQQTTTYTFTPVAGQCAITTTMTINIENEVLPLFNPVRPYCPGSAIAALPTVSNNGIHGTWSPEINNEMTTTYTFTPDAGQCALPTTLTIEIGTDIIPDFDLVGPFCPGTDIESLPTVSKNGIRGRWSPVMNNMVTTNYLFTPLDGQCAVSTSLTCEIGSEVTPTFVQVGPYCYGSTIAALPTTSTNGVTGTWQPAIDNTQTTTYTFTPTPGRCALPTTMTIIISDETVPDFAPVSSYCVGADIAALPTTSINNITGSWSPAIDNTRTTTYTFTPDPGQCATTTQRTITINNETVPTFVAIDSYCQDAVIPALPVISTNAIRGTWSPAIDNTQTTTYTFTPDPGQCATSTTMVIVIDQKVTPAFTPVASYCPGSVIPALPFVSNNGISGTWSPAINNQQTTTYTFTPGADQCATSADLIIEIKESIVPVFALTDLYCAGALIPNLPRTSINGITGSWSPAINNQQTTTYTFTPNPGQCATIAQQTILINPEPAMPVARVISPDCNIPTGTVEVASPRGSQYQYRLDGGNYQNEFRFSGLVPGSSHTLQVKDVLTGCESRIATATVSSLPQPPSLPVVIVVANPKCNDGGAIEVTDPTGPDYEYRMDGGRYQSQASFINVTSGDHLITVRNKINGCESRPARVFIPDVARDFDYDGIADTLDADVDGDGILNDYEGGLAADNDGDGHLNYMDIDADGDGIVDNLEAQNAKDYILPSQLDKDNDGLDDAYDNDMNGSEIIPEDSDKDGIADFMDFDADNDLVPDFIEGHDADSNGKPDHYTLNEDDDNDGLDNGYDMIPNICGARDNALGSNAPTQDFDIDGISDWRDENDDDDEFLTRFEDLNGDGDYSNDDIDFDGYPEYLDYGRDCDLFIPDAFSPNGDNVHDLYMIYCINHYPDATIFIFDQLGNKIYEKRHYGNLEFWKIPEAAWWNGKPTRGPGYSKNDLVPPGTYYYVLDLGNGQVKKSYVFVSY